MIHFPDIKAEVQFVSNEKTVEIFLLREDKIYPTISGNKFRKLKYNLERYSQGNHTALLTFGGAYSNHISATAAAGKELKIPTIGIIRGEELKDKIDQNPTLAFAKECGMQLHFITRDAYRNKSNPAFLENIQSQFGDVYFLPEGGTNELAVKGCEEILGEHTMEFDFICCPIGTGGTISGILNSSHKHQKILGFPALKDADFLHHEIKNISNSSNFELIKGFDFGGYGKITPEFIDFLNDFKRQYAVNLDPIYTGKMMYGIKQMIKEDYFPKNSKILAIHTGGLQGILGINQKLKQQNKQLIL